jgi:hypothetical protein
MKVKTSELTGAPDQIRQVADFYDRLQTQRGIIDLRKLEESLK